MKVFKILFIFLIFVNCKNVMKFEDKNILITINNKNDLINVKNKTENSYKIIKVSLNCKKDDADKYIPSIDLDITVEVGDNEYSFKDFKIEDEYCLNNLESISINDKKAILN